MITANIDHQTMRELMEKDPELEVAVKKAMLRTACKTMAKQTLENDVFQTIQQHINDRIKKTFGEFEGYGYSRRFTPTEELKDKIDFMVTDAGRKEMRVLIDEAAKKLDEVMTQRVAAFNQMVNDAIDKNFGDARILALADARINKKLSTLVDAFKSEE